MPSSYTPITNNAQYLAFKHLRQVYPYLDMELLATVTPWEAKKLANLFALWFPKRISQHNNLLQHNSATCYLCHAKKKPSEALNITCDTCFTLLLDKLNTHPMVYSNWNPHVEAIASKHLTQQPSQPNTVAATCAKPLLSQQKPIAWAGEANKASEQAVLTQNNIAHEWVQGWLSTLEPRAVSNHPTGHVGQASLKKIGFVG